MTYQERARQVIADREADATAKQLEEAGVRTKTAEREIKQEEERKERLRHQQFVVSQLMEQLDSVEIATRLEEIHRTIWNGRGKVLTRESKDPDGIVHKKRLILQAGVPYVHQGTQKTREIGYGTYEQKIITTHREGNDYYSETVYGSYTKEMLGYYEAIVERVSGHSTYFKPHLFFIEYEATPQGNVRIAARDSEYYLRPQRFKLGLPDNSPCEPHDYSSSYTYDTVVDESPSRNQDRLRYKDRHTQDGYVIRERKCVEYELGLVMRADAFSLDRVMAFVDNALLAESVARTEHPIENLYQSVPLDINSIHQRIGSIVNVDRKPFMGRVPFKLRFSKPPSI